MRFKKWLAIILCLTIVVTCFSACGKDEDASDGENSEAFQEESTEEIRYELQTVYLCTGYTTTQHDDSGSRTFEFDYDDHGNFIKYKHICNGEVLEHEEYRYDYDSGVCYADHYAANGQLEYTSQVAVGSVHHEIGGMAGERDARFVYNDDGYVIEEYYRDWKYVSTYNDDYTAVEEYAYKDGEETYRSREGTLDGKGNLLSEIFYRADGSRSVTKGYIYDEQGRILRIDTEIHSEYVPYSYPIIYTYDEYGNIIHYDVSYYYGYETTYTYQPYDIWLPVTGE